MFLNHQLQYRKGFHCWFTDHISRPLNNNILTICSLFYWVPSFKQKAGTSDWIFQSSQSFKPFQKLPLSWLPLLLQKPLILLCSSALKLGNTPFRTFWFIPISPRVEKYFPLKVSIFISVKKVSAYMTLRPVSTPHIWHYGNYNLHFKVRIAR